MGNVLMAKLDATGAQEWLKVLDGYLLQGVIGAAELQGGAGYALTGLYL